MLSNQEAVAAASALENDGRVEWARLRRFVRYARGSQKLPWLPDNAETEYRDIAKKSASNWLDLVIRAVAQGLHVDGYGDIAEDSPVWEQGWQANGWDARQHAHHRSIFTCGYGFVFVLPSDDGVWMRPEAATKVSALYEDPSDEWPVRALRVIGDGRSTPLRWELYDEVARYTITGASGARKVQVLEHGVGVCPAVQMRSSLDLLGTPMGEVEPVIPIQDRIVDATFTLQMVAKYGAFPQRWIAGIKVPEDADGNPLPPQIKAYVDHILMAADVDTKFGQFAAADLRQYVEALEAHIKHLAAITQTPPHYLLGSLVNLSAEALAAAESGLQRKIGEKRAVLGEGYEQALRLAALVLGDEDAAMDTSSQVHWQDIESRSLAQTADAILKLKDIVPRPMLLQMIPGWTETDVNEAMALDDSDPIESLARRLEAGTVPAELPVE
jgi:hypothetical protein